MDCLQGWGIPISMARAGSQSSVSQRLPTESVDNSTHPHEIHPSRAREPKPSASETQALGGKLPP